jgi:tetratricopeptide (TPR) repeat protein
VSKQESPPSGGASEQPRIWGGVPPRNPNFTGRAPLLERLREQLTENPTALLPHTLHGLGGVGKTQLAVEYVWRYGDRYDLIWWIAAEQPALIRSSLVELADRLGMPRGEDVDRTLTAVHDALRMHSPHRRWLLIFDNANRPADLGRFLSTPGGHILITSRDRTWSDVAKTVEVDVFERIESIELLRRRMPDIGAAEADRLADHLGDLPLALEQAASWILATATPVSDYLQLLGERVGQLMLEDPPTTYPLPVAATWGLAFDQLRQQAPAAVQLLELSAFLGAEPVSIRMIRDGRLANLPSPLDATVRDEIPLRRAVRDISRYGLAKVDSVRNSIQIHRLVQAVLRDSLTAEQQAGYRQAAHELLAAANPGDPTNDPGTWPRHADITPHVRAAGLIESDSADSHKVVLDQIRYLWVIGDFESSQDLAQTAYADWSAQLGSDYEQTLVAGRHLANALRSAGQTREAALLNRDILDRCRATLGEDHEHTLVTANSVGADLRWQGRWREARESDEDTLRRHVNVFGEDDPITLNCANNLAVDLRLLCDFDSARRVDEDTIRRRRQVLGEEDPRNLWGMNSLSRDYYGLGDFQRAQELQDQSLARHRKVLGDDHSDVIQATRVRVQTLRSIGRRETACEIAEDMVARAVRALGSEHPVTLHAMTALANSLADADRLAEACTIGESAYAGFRRELSEQNPFTLAAATNLAIMLRRSGDLLAARGLNEAALTDFTAVLGTEHPYTLNCAVNAAVDLALSLEHAAAVALGARTLELLRAWGGPAHPDYLVCLSNHAIDLQAAGDVEQASQRRDEALAGMRKVLGHDHPETLLTEAGRHNALWIEPSTP